jgi:glycosyltransferase involved in cell wall biosynthesis
MDLTPVEKIGDLAASAGLRRIHILAWRDLDDVEAGGSEVHAHEVARRWAAAGLDVTMRTSAAFGHPHELRRDGYRVVRRAGRYAVFPRGVLAEIAGRHGQRDALVEVWNGVPWVSPIWARGPRMVFMHHLHRKMWPLVLSDSPTLARVGEVVERRIAPPLYRTTPIVTLSESSRAELTTELGFSPDRVHVVPPGIDPRFSPGGALDPRPLVVSVSRLMAPKRFDVVLRAAAAARREVPDLQLVVVGKGEERERLEQLRRELDAEEWVTFAGFLDDQALVDLYRRAWVLTNASIAEGWGMTVTEAAACGTPAVVSDIPGHRDAVRDGTSGLLASDEHALADGIAAVLSDPDLRSRLSQGALARAAELTWDATALGTLQVLADEARHRSRSA